MTQPHVDIERMALDVVHDVYAAVRHSEALRAQDHWQRFANRIASAAFAHDAASFLGQVSRRFGVAHTPGDALVTLLGMGDSDQRMILRKLRRDANALTVLVRHERKNNRR